MKTLTETRNGKTAEALVTGNTTLLLAAFHYGVKFFERGRNNAPDIFDDFSGHAVAVIFDFQKYAQRRIVEESQPDILRERIV